MTIIKDITDIVFLPFPKNNRFKNIKSQVFGKLTAIGYVGKNKENRSMWACKCECGNYVTVISKHLINKNTKSCGCFNIEQIKIRSTTHGHTTTNPKGTDEFRTWLSIKTRCFVTNDKSYKNYGGRGITMCKEWVDDFQAFFDYIGKRPSKKHSVDRINVNGHYEKGNIRWATGIQQARNRRNNFILTYEGKSKCLAEWEEETGIKQTIIRNRIKKSNWCIKCALTIPNPCNKNNICKHNSDKRWAKVTVTYNGTTQSITKWAEQTKICFTTLMHRYYSGWCHNCIITIPVRGKGFKNNTCTHKAIPAPKFQPQPKKMCH